MCGRYLIEDEAYADILEILNNINKRGNYTVAGGSSGGGGTSGVLDPSGAGDFVSKEFRRGEVFPTNLAPVIMCGGVSDTADVGSDAGDGVGAAAGASVGAGVDGVDVATVKWGFPHWKNSGVIINARAETALEKNMFKKPLRERRCVIPSSGFFEWSRSSDRKVKDKYLFRRPGEDMIFMAGMVNTFHDAQSIPYNAFIILTTAANDFVSPIHDRMPVILSPDEIDLWLRDDAFMEYALQRIGPELSALQEDTA